MVEKGIKKRRKRRNYKITKICLFVVNEKGEAMLMKYDDFFKVKKNVSSAKCAAEKPKLENVQVVRFVKGSLKLQWKKSYNEENFHSAIFLQKKAVKVIHSSFPVVESPRGINREKKEKIVSSLLIHLDENRRRFWLDMPTNDNSRDLSY